MSDYVTPLLRTLQWLLSPQGESESVALLTPRLDSFWLGLGKGCPCIAAFSGIHGLYPPDASGTHPLHPNRSCPLQNKLVPTENHCFTGIKGPTLSVLILLLLLLVTPAIMASAFKPPSTCLCADHASCYSLFLKCSPRHHMAIQHSCMDVCNLSNVIVILSHRITFHEGKDFCFVHCFVFARTVLGI